MNQPIRKDTISLELVEWLLERLQSEDELDTITHQLEALVLPLQGKPRADLYAHISRRIFEKYSTNPGQFSANLYARLCQSLFLASLRIHNPSGPDPITTVHDYLFSSCVTLPLGYRVDLTRQPETTNARSYDNYESIRLTDTALLENAGSVNIESTAPLVSSLFGFSLISVAQVYQYLFQLIHPSLTSSTESTLSSVCTLLEAHGRNLNVTAWEGEMGRLLEWAEATILEDTIDEDIRQRTRAITFSLGRSRGQEPFTGADREKTAPSPKSPSGELGSTGNNYGSHTPTDEFEARSSPQPTKTLGSMELRLGKMLTKLEEGDFDDISDQIIEWLNKSEKEEGGKALMKIAKLICERVKETETFGKMYARLCRKAMEQISPSIQDESIQNSEGKLLNGGMLFRKCLLNQCQEGFERRWSAEVVAPDANNVVDCRGPGLVLFIAELFKLQMLTERVVHDCIKKLLSNIVNPEEEEIESLCKLLTTVGQSLDNSKARNHMDVYFERMQDMAKSSNINSRMQFMLLDVIELRSRHWQSRANLPRPTPAHQDSSRDDSDKHGVTRGGSRRDKQRGNGTEPDGWSVAGGASASRPLTRVGDLSQFGKISKPTGIQFGPSSVFNRESNKRDSSTGRASSASMFSALSAGVADRMSSGRGPSVDFGPGGFPASSGIAARKKIVLQPKTAKTTETGVNETDIEGERKEAMAAEEAEYKVKEDVKEYLGVENIDEAIMALEALPSEHRHLFVDKLINASMDGGNKIVALTEKLFSAARSRSVITAEGFERGMLPTIEMADDLSIDVPKTYEWLARMIHAAGFDKAKTEEMARRISVYGEPRIPPREFLMKEFERVSSTPVGRTSSSNTL